MERVGGERLEAVVLIPGGSPVVEGVYDDAERRGIASQEIRTPRCTAMPTRLADSILPGRHLAY